MIHKKQKAITKTPTSPPVPLPWGEGGMLHKKQKALAKPTKKRRLGLRIRRGDWHLFHELRPRGIAW